MTAYPVLTFTTFLPLVGAALILLFGGERLARWIALATTLGTLAVSAPLYLHFDKASSTLQFVESRDWIPSLNITYALVSALRGLQSKREWENSTRRFWLRRRL